MRENLDFFFFCLSFLTLEFFLTLVCLFVCLFVLFVCVHS